MDIEEALKTGFERTKAQNGLRLIGVFFVINLVSTIASQSNARRALNQIDQLPEFLQDTFVAQPGPLAFNLPSSLTTLMNLGSSVGFVVAAIVAYRVFASDVRDRIPEEAYQRNIGMATLNGVVAGIIFAVLFVIGIALLVVPGIFVFVSLAFFLVFVALEDESFIDSLQSSWGLTEGRRMSVFLLFVAVLIINIVVSIIGGIAGAAVGAVVPQLGALLNVAVGSALSVFGFAVLVNAYFQLRDSAPDSGGEDEGVAA